MSGNNHKFHINLSPVMVTSASEEASSAQDIVNQTRMQTMYQEQSKENGSRISSDNSKNIIHTTTLLNV